MDKRHKAVALSVAAAWARASVGLDRGSEKRRTSSVGCQRCFIMLFVAAGAHKVMSLHYTPRSSWLLDTASAFLGCLLAGSSFILHTRTPPLLALSSPGQGEACHAVSSPVYSMVVLSAASFSSLDTVDMKIGAPPLCACWLDGLLMGRRVSGREGGGRARPKLFACVCFVF